MLLYLKEALDVVLGWPVVIYVIGLSILCTFMVQWAQVRYFCTAWKLALTPSKEKKDAHADMTPLQAFINTLSSNLGNGSIAGVATALCLGGPGAPIWILIVGFFLMAVRFVEIYLSLYVSMKKDEHSAFGGPMHYLHDVPFGSFLAYTYAVFGLFYGLLIGNAAQTNSIALSLYRTWHIDPYITAVVFCAFAAYVLIGGAQRIAKINEAIVPVKVAVFFAASIALLAYHHAAIMPALSFMITAAFSGTAAMGGIAGFTVIQAMRFGVSRVTFATESGVGTAAIMFGSTGSKEPVKDATLGMLSTFISSLVCFLIGLCIVASGVWDNGLTSTPLTISAFETVFGISAGWIVSFLSTSFGMGVLVAYGYIARETWRYVTNDRYPELFIAIFCLMAFFGAVANVEMIWLAGEVANAGMLFINMFGLTCLLPIVHRGVVAYQKKHAAR